MSGQHYESYTQNENQGTDQNQIKENEILLKYPTNEDDFQAKIEILLKRIGRSQNNIQKSMEDLKKCINEYYNHHNQTNFATNLQEALKQLNEIAVYYLNAEKTEISLIILNECDIYTQTYNGFADICYFRKCKDQKRALKLLEKAETIHQKNQTSTNIGITYLNKSAILSEMGSIFLMQIRHSEAIKCANSAVIELKKQFEKAFNKKNERLETKQNIKNFKNTLNSNQKVDDDKLEEAFNAREEENRQINQEFADIVTELSIAYYNLAAEEQYQKQFDKSIKNFYHAYMIVKEYLGDNHPLAIQFLQSFETTNKKFEQNTGQESITQKKQYQKINDNTEYQAKNSQLNLPINLKANQKTIQLDNGVVSESYENTKQSFEFQQDRKYHKPQETNMINQQIQGNTQSFKLQMKQINSPVYNLLYSDDDEDKQTNEIYSFKNLNTYQTHMESKRQQFQSPKYPINNSNSKTKIKQHSPIIYNNLYFDNPKDFIKQQKNLKPKQIFSSKQSQLNQSKSWVQSTQGHVDNTSQFSESLTNNENRLRNLEIDEFIHKRNKSLNSQQSPYSLAPKSHSSNDRYFFDQSTKQSIKESDVQSQKNQVNNDQNHPGFFLAKKMQGRYSKIGSIRPQSAQEILSQPIEKKEVGGNKYKINPKLLIPDTIIEAANKYQDYLSRESSIHTKKNFVIKSQSQKNFNQIHKENIKNYEAKFHLNQQNRFDHFEKSGMYSKTPVGKQKIIPFQNIGKFSTQTYRTSDKKLSQNQTIEKTDGNIRQNQDIMKDQINLKQTNYDQERQKPISKWNFEKEPKPNKSSQDTQNIRCQTAKSNHSRQGSFKVQINNIMQLNENKTHPDKIATEIPEDFLIISPYMNILLKTKGESQSILRKGRLCCVFDDKNYLLIFAFQDFQLGQGIEIEEQCKLYISFAQLKDIFTSNYHHQDKRKQNQSKQYSQQIQYEKELSNLKAELLRENLEMICNKFKPIIQIDQDKKQLALDRNFKGSNVLLKTPLHPKGIETKINFPYASQIASTHEVLIQISQNQQENYKNIRNFLFIEYPSEEQFLLKENRKLDELPDYFIILYTFQFTQISNKHGIIAVLLNCQTQQIQFIFKSLDQQLCLCHYIVIEHIIQDYGPFYESQDTQIALNLLCENLMTIWIIDGKNLTYENNKWSLKNEIEVPNQGIKQLNYQIVQQPSKDLSLIQKQEIWLEVYDEDELQIIKREQLDKIDESHESEDDSRQEKTPLNRYVKTHPSSQFSYKDNKPKITNSITIINQNFQIVNKQDNENYSDNKEYQQQFNQEYNALQYQENFPNNKNKKSLQDQNLNYQNQKYYNNQAQLYSSLNNNEIMNTNQFNQQQQQQQQFSEFENNIEKQNKFQRNQQKKNSNRSIKSEQNQYDVNAQKLIYEKLDLEREQKDIQSMQENLNKVEGQLHQEKSPLQQFKNTQRDSLTSSQRDSLTNSQRDNTINTNRSQSSRLQVDIQNNLQKRGFYTQNEMQEEEGQIKSKQHIIYSENQESLKNTNNQISQKNKYQEINGIQLHKTAINQTDISSKRNMIHDKSEANHQKQRKDSLIAQFGQNSNNHLLNVSQEKEGDVEYIDMNDTQQIYK